MKLSWHMLYQVLLMLAQVLNATTNMVSDKWKPVVVGALALVQLILGYVAHNTYPDGVKIVKCLVFACMLALVISVPVFAQTAEAPIFNQTTFNFNLAPISLPGGTNTLSATEADVMLKITDKDQIGSTNLLNQDMVFVGGRYNRLLPSVSTWLNNHSGVINGYKFQFGLTASLGSVRVSGAPKGGYWGERAGFFANYGINDTWGIGLEAQWNNFPGVARHTPSIALGPSFHF